MSLENNPRDVVLLDVMARKTGHSYNSTGAPSMHFHYLKTCTIRWEIGFIKSVTWGSHDR